MKRATLQLIWKTHIWHLTCFYLTQWYIPRSWRQNNTLVYRNQLVQPYTEAQKSFLKDQCYLCRWWHLFDRKLSCHRYTKWSLKVDCSHLSGISERFCFPSSQTDQLDSGLMLIQELQVNKHCNYLQYIRNVEYCILYEI